MCNPVKFVPKQFFILEQYKNFVREKKYFGTKNSYWALSDSLTANRPSDF